MLGVPPNMATSLADLTMSQLRHMIMGAALDAVAAGAWLGDARRFSSVDVLETCRRGRPDDTAVQCCGENWEAFAISLTELHALSLRTLEALLQRRTEYGGPLGAGRLLLLLPPPDSFTVMHAVDTALYFLQSGVLGGALPSGSNGAPLAVRRAVVVRALLASGTLHQLARALAAAGQQLLLQASKQQLPGEQLEQPCGPSAGFWASVPQAPLGQPLPPPSRLSEMCADLLAASAGVLGALLVGMAGDVRARTATLAALADSQLLEHMAATALAVCIAVSSGGSSGETVEAASFNSNTIGRTEARMYAKVVAGLACGLFELTTHSTLTAAASASHGSRAAGSSSAGGSSTSASGGGGSVVSLGGGCHRSSQHGGRQQPQQPEGAVPRAAAGQSAQPGGPAAASAASTAGSARTGSCNGVHVWTELQVPATAAACGGFVTLAADHFLGGALLHTLLAMQLRLALPTLEAGRHAAGGAAARGAGEAPDSLGLGGLVGSSTIKAEFSEECLLKAMPEVLSACHFAMCAAAHSSATSSAASAEGGVRPFTGAQLSGSHGAVLACSPGQVASLVVRVVSACASRLDTCHTLSLHRHPKVFRVYTVCEGLLEVSHVVSLMYICWLRVCL